jgi:predicted nucleic acid-binding protein
MLARTPTTVVITDTNILINFMHVGLVELFGDLPPYQFHLPMEVLNELTCVSQRDRIEAAIENGQLHLTAIDTLDTLTLFGDLRDLMGRGEAACLALAATTGCYLASDEKRCFRRRATELIGAKKILRTEDLIADAIRCNRLTIEQADECKQILATQRYVMPFVSFSERV